MWGTWEDNSYVSWVMDDYLGMRERCESKGREGFLRVFFINGVADYAFLPLNTVVMWYEDGNFDPTIFFTEKNTLRLSLCFRLLREYPSLIQVFNLSVRHIYQAGHLGKAKSHVFAHPLKSSLLHIHGSGDGSFPDKPYS